MGLEFMNQDFTKLPRALTTYTTPNLTSRGQYRGSVTCPGGLRWAFWTWREVIGWIHWLSDGCFDLIAAYKIPMWLLNKGREKASGIVRYSQCEAQMHTSESTVLNCNACIYVYTQYSAYRPMMKWGMAIKKVPKDITTHPIAMIFGRWSLAPK